ncbi:mechanosensitive ion channel family protein [Helicobacter sp. MIT 14-3879]|uniref:mechanosensitive ion channel family protein n=1 Tax=Helicobacter sp. MIT 14-3879 TaxID=2040649 RepID=UPI000E1ED56B|nr:mechanosensitive ion channel domain-containing protein [Helicobacter sp. MIT 14-3879]RDU62435.1 hypothetical protein CQA44_06885 [Helicobacter sp. MIT 14-3879]
MRIILLFLIFFINVYSDELSDIELNIKNNPWIIKYKNYNEYNIIYNEMINLESKIDELKKLPQSLEINNKLHTLDKKYHTIKKQEELLRNYKNEPYKELIEVQNVNEIPRITNPFLISSGLSYINNINSQIKIIEDNYRDLDNLLSNLHIKAKLLSRDNSKKQEFQNTKEMITELDSAKKISSLYIDIFKKNANNDIKKVNNDIKKESLKLLYIIVTIAVISIISFITKFLLKLYAQRDDNNNGYMINKVINVANISIIILILLFAYIENVAYIIAIIGFVSAGLAIAMKDWFMSFFGYIVIVGGGSIKSGDRIRVVKDNTTYVGDVIDISMLRITLYEDVTYTTYKYNRRAGRIIFIPNNLIFTTMIANYSHSNMKTVWDGIDITITFNSNYKKALLIASNIAKKYSSGYTESTRRNLSMLKIKYSIRDMNVEPRVFSFIVPNGIKISIWFQTNAYATLMINSLISGEIVESFLKENDIEISYPTTTIIPKDKFLTNGEVLNEQ